MSFAVDDIRRVKELSADGMSACAIECYMSDMSLGSVRTMMGRQPGKRVVPNDDLSVRERGRYINWEMIK